MKIVTCTAVIAALIATPAFAADMPVKAPYAPAPAVYNWTGWYVGVNAGASFGSVNTDFNAAPVTVVTSAGTFTTPGFSGSNREYPSGFMGGGQIGYNYQWSPLIVVGLEADFQGAAEKDSETLTNSFSGTLPPAFAITGTAVTDYATKIDWFGTVRGRIGYVWGNGTVLTYVTGGFAYGRVDMEGTNTVSGTVGGTPFSITDAIGHSQVNTGWVLGYGTEGVIDFWGARNWTWIIEGLYVDLGHLNDTDAQVLPPHIISVTGGQTITNTHFTDGILRAGLNYKFY